MFIMLEDILVVVVEEDMPDMPDIDMVEVYMFCLACSIVYD